MKKIFKRRKQEEFKYLTIARDAIGLANYPLQMDIIHAVRALKVEMFLGSQLTVGEDGIAMSNPEVKKKEERPSYVV